MKDIKYTRLDIEFPTLGKSFPEPLETKDQLVRSKIRLENILPDYNIKINAKTNVFIPRDNDFNNSVVDGIYNSSSKNLTLKVSDDLNKEVVLHYLEYFNSLYQQGIIKNNLSIQKTKDNYKVFVTFDKPKLRDLFFKIAEFGGKKPFLSNYTLDSISKERKFIDDYKKQAISNSDEKYSEALQSLDEGLKEKEIHEAGSHYGTSFNKIYSFSETLDGAMNLFSKLVDGEYLKLLNMRNS